MANEKSDGNPPFDVPDEGMLMKLYAAQQELNKAAVLFDAADQSLERAVRRGTGGEIVRRSKEELLLAEVALKQAAREFRKVITEARVTDSRNEDPK